jgi:hypothetical protein
MKNVKKVSKELSAKLVSKPKPTVTMISYSMKMVIPTGQYANIQPEIVVKASNPEEAHDYIAKHMDKMWKEYFMVNERVNQEAPKVVQPILTPEVMAPTGPTGPVAEASPTSNVAVIKATQAIESCMSLEALDLIKNQIELSVKLDKTEKPKLRDMVTNRFNELNADAFVKRNS